MILITSQRPLLSELRGYPRFWVPISNASGNKLARLLFSCPVLDYAGLFLIYSRIFKTRYERKIETRRTVKTWALALPWPGPDTPFLRDLRYSVSLSLRFLIHKTTKTGGKIHVIILEKSFQFQNSMISKTPHFLTSTKGEMHVSEIKRNN